METQACCYCGCPFAAHEQDVEIIEGLDIDSCSAHGEHYMEPPK